MRRAGLWAPPIVYMLAIFHFSSESQPMPVVTEHVWDKLLHFVEYGVLAGLFARGLIAERVRLLRAVVLAVMLTSFYGATDEYHQAFVPLRSSDVHDWFADSLGASIGAFAYAALRRYDVTAAWFSTASRRPRPPRR
jgi:VanZ family protein